MYMYLCCCAAPPDARRCTLFLALWTVSCVLYSYV